MVFKNTISWFEIPTSDINRAQKFYETIFDITMISIDFPHQMRIFPTENYKNINGAICFNPDFYKSSDTGTLVYLNGNPDVQNILDKIEAAGGKIVVSKLEVSPEHGHIAVFIDTEGNRVGLHSVPMNQKDV
jgi:predicted enzyme related to lactoylglutathione lyase